MPTGIYFRTEEIKQKISEGHKGKKHSPKILRLMSEIKLGERNPNFGRHPSEQTRRRMSESRKGEKHPLFGKHHSEETREKISKSRTGDKNPCWQGGKSTQRGYVIIWKPEHLRSSSKGYVREHILVWENIYGTILNGMTIHHKNFIKNDNRIENLECLSISGHTRFHHELRKIEKYKKVEDFIEKQMKPF